MKQNSIAAVIFLWFNLIDQAHLLECYKCFADRGSSCDPAKTRKCSDNEICLTMSYKELYKGKVQTNFVKGCVSGWDKCQSNCEDDSWIGCKESCCRENLCNEETVEEVIWYALSSTNSGRHVAAGSKMLIFILIGMVVYSTTLV